MNKFSKKLQKIKWFIDIVKFTNNDTNKIYAIIDDYTGKGIKRLCNLNIAIRTNGNYFDRNCNKDINKNFVKLILADDLKDKKADYPLPESRQERIKIAEVILDCYSQYGIDQLKKHFNGEVLDKNIGRVIHIEVDKND
jgi:hypothetical protein